MSRHKRNLIATVLLCGLLLPAAAAGTDAADCDNASTQAQMNACAAQDYTREDARLNTLYTALAHKLDKPGRTELLKVQRAWLKYRDLQCDHEARQVEGGSMQPMVRSACLAHLTQQRNQIIQSMLDQASL